MKKLTTLQVQLICWGLALLVIGILRSGILAPKSTTNLNKPEKKGAYALPGKVAGRYAQEFQMTRDPKTNTVPRERLLKAYQVAEKKRAQLAEKEAAIPVYWQERGPNNVGGRTRGLIFDMNDPTQRTVWAAGVAGGLWRTTNIDAAVPTWTNSDDFFDNLAITTIAQNPANPNILYFGTGETGFNNADAVRGLGIWRSMDGGANWARLPATATFTVINKIVVDAAGQVYAATNAGIRRSTDNGLTWPVLAGAPTGAVQDLEIAADGDIFAGVNSGGVFRSQGGTWAQVTTGLPATGFGRIELACAPGDANTVYAMLENPNGPANTSPCLGIFQSTDGGTNWVARTVPALGVFCWYAEIMAVDPNNSNRLWAGNQSLFVSGDGGATWTGIGGVHADHHAVVYRPGNSNEVIFGNDGGVYRSTNGAAATPTLVQKNNSYNVTQFYANCLHPNSGSNYILGGTQDNGTQRLNSPGLGSSDEPTGADGTYCFIDQDNPNIQITGSQNGWYNLSTDGGASFNGIIFGKAAALFITPAELDDAANVFYFSDARDTLGRMSDVGGANTITYQRIAELNGRRISAFATSVASTATPATANRLFIGSESGRVLRIDNAHNNGGVTVTNLNAPTSSYISSIAVAPGDDNRIAITTSSFGVNSVWQTTDGGATWQSIEGDLPDMPVRWAMFHPFDTDKMLLATELGVWSTDDLNGTATEWWPTNNYGLANVRVDMLQYRRSDHLVVAATHGRGMYSTDYFTLLTTCVPSLFVGGSIAPGIYMAEDFVESDGTIAPGRKVIFHAGNYVRMTTGFHARRGSDLWALIEECGITPFAGPLADRQKPLGSKANAPDGSSEAQVFSGEKAAVRCFPNPAHAALFVEYRLPEDGRYSLYVRNLQGQLVQVFATDDPKPAGTYRLELNAADYEGGLYLLTLQTVKGAVTERFVVVK